MVIDLTYRDYILKYLSEIFLAGILGLSAFLNIWNIWNQGITEFYYAAAVRSMLINPAGGLFNSFDPAGFVTLDKPPVGIWIQSLFATVFGFSGWVLVLPQALAGIGSVAFIYFIITRPFGKTAGLVSALALAITPIFVAVSRNGTMDTQLIFVLLLAVWVVLKATREHSLRWLLVSVILIGIGFNIKMIQAFIVVPAVLAVYFLGTTTFPFKKQVLHLGIAVLVLLAVSLSWAVAVDMIPPNQRPYIGGSGDNTVLGLIINFNGLQRLGLESTEKAGRGYGGGVPGILCLFWGQLAGQISWLIPLALIGLLVWVRKPSNIMLERFENAGIANERKFTLIAMLLWLLPCFLYFSFVPVNDWLSYYTATMAPPLAGIVSIGIVAMYREYSSEGWKGYILIGAVLITGLLQVLFLSYNASWSGLLIPVILIGTMGCAGGLACLRIRKGAVSENSKKFTVIIALGLLFVTPLVWAFTPMLYGIGSIFQPTAGPQNILINSDNTWPTGIIPYMGEAKSTQLENFLLSHNTNETWILAVPNVWSGASLIINTGKPVMALGGYYGTDQILNTRSLVTLIKEGKVRYFLPLGVTSRGWGMNSGNSEIARWVDTHCTALNLNNGNETIVNATSSATSLFDCAKAASPE
jgi:4-amino-4-deoxy-L-arabinose transferase-like glycosyltransferase